MSAGTDAPVSSVMTYDMASIGVRLATTSKKIAETIASDDQDRPEPDQPLFRARRTGRGASADSAAHGRPAGATGVGVAPVSGRRRRRIGRRRDIDDDEVRLGRRRRRAAARPIDPRPAARSRSTPGARAGSPDSRDVRNRPASLKLRAGLAIDGGGHEPGRRQRRRRQGDRVGEQLAGCASPSSWSNIRMTTRIVGLSCEAASAALRLARSSSPVRTITDAVSTSAWLRTRDSRGSPTTRRTPAAVSRSSGSVFGPMADDRLVAHPQLVDRPQAEVIESADDHVAGGEHPRSLRSGRTSRDSRPDAAVSSRPRGPVAQWQSS